MYRYKPARMFSYGLCLAHTGCNCLAHTGCNNPSGSTLASWSVQTSVPSRAHVLMQAAVALAQHCNAPGTKQGVCSEDHAVPGMINVVSPVCAHKSCSKIDPTPPYEPSRRLPRSGMT